MQLAQLAKSYKSVAVTTALFSSIPGPDARCFRSAYPESARRMEPSAAFQPVAVAFARK